MKKILLYFLLFLVLLITIPLVYLHFSDCGVSPLACGEYTTKGTPTTKKIPVSSGPEDMALDNSQGYPRIIVSCSERRLGKPKIGTFHSINPKDNSTTALQIIPTNFSIHPHGIDVVTIDSIPYLYAITHDPSEAGTQHSIVRFKIEGDQLILDEANRLSNALLTGPNDLDVLEDGSMYVTNPLPNNDPNESAKSILGFKNGNVLHYDGKGKWAIVLKDLCYPNGILINEKAGHLFVANGGCEEINRYNIGADGVDQASKISTKQQDVSITVGDNLLMDNKGVLWTAAHPCPLKFTDHKEDSANPSPMQVFAIDPNTLKSNMVFQNNGDLISTASTVLHFEDRLYISQVFDPFVLVVENYE